MGSHADPINVMVWSDADVLIAPLTAVDPMPGQPFSAEWKYVGALDGSDGFGGDRESDEKDHYAWGAGIVAHTSKNYKESKTFTAMENNPVVRELDHPGSTFTTDQTSTNVTATLKVPQRTKFKAAFVNYNGTRQERYITKNYAQLDSWVKGKRNEESVDTREVSMAIFPTVNKELWNYQNFPDTTV